MPAHATPATLKGGTGQDSIDPSVKLIRRYPWHFGLAVGLCLLVALAVDLLQLTRASMISAVACTPVLFQGQPEANALLSRYHDGIAEQSARNDLPPELVAAVIVNHQVEMSSFRRYTDCAGSALGANLSIGLAQLRIGTAARLDGKEVYELSHEEYRALRARLLSPEQNIAYEARELRSLLEREHRYPGMSAEQLIHDPFAMALLITEYRTGRMKTEKNDSGLNAAAFAALQWMADGSVDQFGRDPDTARQIQTRVREYLQHIYCESGIFNAGVCESWQQGPA